MDALHTQLKKRIMRRVYIVAFMRRFLRPFVVKSAMLSVFVFVGAVSVSVPNVIQNALQSGRGGLSGFVTFIFDAFFQTDLFVKMVFLGIVVTLMWLVVDALRNLGHSHTQATV